MIPVVVGSSPISHPKHSKPHTAQYAVFLLLHTGYLKACSRHSASYSAESQRKTRMQPCKPFSAQKDSVSMADISIFESNRMSSPWPLPDFEQKICPPEQLASRLAALPRPVVFTNGCFDILHRGHVTYLAQARACGEAMILALNTDASVRRQGKGSDRPINPLANRAAVAAALASVDLVTWFDNNTPLALIELIQPDVLIKGGDWAVENIVGAPETLARGGMVYSIPFLHQTSTTQMLANIRAAEGQK